MNTMFRWLTALLFGGALAFGIYSNDPAVFTGGEYKAGRKYSSVIYPGLLFLFLVMIWGIGLIGGHDFSLEFYFAQLADIFIQIAVFYFALMMLLPLLRKFISPKIIGIIWLLPNYMYLTTQSFMTRNEPKWVIRTEGISFSLVAWIWFVVAALVFAWYLIRHCIFRFQLLHDAKPVEEEWITELWKECQRSFDLKKAGYKMVVSTRTRTPLSIGVSRLTTVLVIPDRSYTEAELKLIFKHELIHIIRGDSQIKLFIALCNALCWFNPLMWFAMKKCTEDLELSCDEFVLEEADKQEKALYGKLILSTAGNEAGFTTCLSANASALKYRLGNIYRPKRKWSGGIIAGAFLAVMLLTSGMTAFSYNYQKVNDVFSAEVDQADMDVQLTYADGSTWYAYACKDPAALQTYIMNLKVSELTGNYELDEEAQGLFGRFETDRGLIMVEIRGNGLKYVPFYDLDEGAHLYHLEEAVDWEYIMSLIEVEGEKFTYH